jgi:hypothetical protein
MVEPFSTVLLGTLVSEFAKGGVEAFFDHLDSRPAAAAVQPAPQARTEPMSIIDLTSNRPESVRASIALSATTAYGQPSPYWALFGIQAAEGARRLHYALHGEQVEVRVAPGRYDLSAMFLTKPASFRDMPLLVAVGSTHEVLASSGVQPVALTGSPPTTAQIDQIKAQLQGKPMPFRLPASTALPASSPAAGAAPVRSLGGRLPLRGGLDPAIVAALTKCDARGASGQQCGNRGKPIADLGARFLCQEHELAVRRGDRVVSHRTGQRIKPMSWWDKWVGF